MIALKQFTSRIPYWAYLLVLMAVFVITVFMVFRGRMTQSGSTEKLVNSQYIFDYVKTGGIAYKAGIRTGDTLISLNNISVQNWTSGQYGLSVGDTVVVGVLKNNAEIKLPIVLGSILSMAPGFFWTIYIIMAIFSISSLYLLYKKPNDRAVQLLFIYIQLFIITVNAQHLDFYEAPAFIAEIAFRICGNLSVPVLINFLLLFPKPMRLPPWFKQLPLFIYIIGALIAIAFVAGYLSDWLKDAPLGSMTKIIDRISLWWFIMTFIIALATAINQYILIRDTLSRNQLRIIIIGISFSCITPVMLGFFYDYLNEFNNKFPYLVQTSQGIGGIILICCILVAIFRYRIWDIEIFIRKALLYIGATLVIIVSYLILIYLVDQFIIKENDFTRFLTLAISVSIFLVLRDGLQRMVDRVFHRETYDSATVVSNFEGKLAGIYPANELQQSVVLGLDEIFHFKSLVFHLKKEELDYESAYWIGLDVAEVHKECRVTTEFETRLKKSWVFSPAELDQKPPFLERSNGELIVPLLKEDQPFGFFLCGPKQSELVYSLQDIRVLSLIAKRVIALFHTAGLYQKDLDRQLMLERERARISQDMHDDIGAGLTKIAMISEGLPNFPQHGQETDARMSKVASTAREMIARLNVIVWALNPKDDNLVSLVAYSRRYFGEYLDNFSIRFKMEVTDTLPDLSLTPDFRRNVFYSLQEAIHNAVKHGACTEIGIVLKISKNQMTISITDNGHGFDQKMAGTSGNGLLNMKKRAEDLGGSFEIQSSPQIGTRVLFIIRLP